VTPHVRVPRPTARQPNGRTFTDQSGNPFFWLGDTQWELCRSLQLDDVRVVVEDRRQKGFSVLQVILTGVGDGTGPNVAGDTPWRDDDPDTPNERYFAHVDAVLELARDSGMVLVLGVYHQLHAPRLTAAKARAYARWIARRYREAPHLVWALYPRADEAFLPVVRELAAGLQEATTGSTHHRASRPLTRLLELPAAGRHRGLARLPLDPDLADTHLIVPMVTHDYQLRPTKPVVMAEGAYEAGEEYGFEVTPLWCGGRRTGPCSPAATTATGTTICGAFRPAGAKPWMPPAPGNSRSCEMCLPRGANGGT